MADINRSAISLPTDVAQEILQKTQDDSAVMRLARRIALPGRGATIPVITADPTAAWVSETGAKPVSNSNLSSKVMQAYKLAVIETFSAEFVRDAKALYDTLVDRLPRALAMQFDATVIGAVDAPGENFDRFNACTTQALKPAGSATTYDGLVAADADISAHGGILNGFALAPQARALLLGAKDTTGRPIFINSVAEGAIPLILGAPTVMSKGCYKAGTAPVGSTAGTPAIVGIAGDWSQALYGTVEGVQIKLSDTATVVSGSGTSAITINLWQQNMVAVLAEIEIGFRADTACFNLLSGETPAS